MREEEDVRRKVKTLKRFYMDVIYFGIINAILILIWLAFDRTGAFWPKYVLAIWGIALVFKAYRMKVVPFIFLRVPFLNQGWEDKKVREIMRQHNIHPKAPHLKTSHPKPPIKKNKKEK